MRLEGLAQFGAGVEAACGDDDLGIAFGPIGKGRGDGVGQPVAGVFDKGDAGAGKEALGLDGVQQKGGVFPEVGGGNACQAHFLFPVGADQGGDDLLAFQGDAHGVLAIDQKPGGRFVGFGEIAAGIAGRQFHRDRDKRSDVMRSAMITIRRRRASRCAKRVATVVEVAE